MPANDCLEIEKQTFGDSGLREDPVPQPRSWLKEQEESGGIRWVENMTAVLAFPRSDLNIAHYSPRILFLWALMHHAQVRKHRLSGFTRSRVLESNPSRTRCC
uniref:Uncharacterized protein n=1 Tax=Rhodosorus marinus TaxID=101924 RepID=A0A7S0G2X8_9RHOD|mmetsp:Transcript_20352/g.29543  ORF Transcript_20352/g.29543 Transcript_20352/m.29543 type:complete len:103 (+) Transcript_20352:693-1001(+)